MPRSLDIRALAGTPGARTGYAAYRLAERLPLGLGKRVYSGMIRLAAPYFLSIPATVTGAEPGRAEVRMRQAPWTRNHLGTVHAIALCNLAELSMGVAAEATVPASHRWIPKRMSVEYRAKARGTMHATAELTLPDPPPGPEGAGSEVPVEITVADESAVTVFTAEITIWVSAAD